MEVIEHSQILIFADDIKLFRKIANPGDCVKLQVDVNHLIDWCKSNCLPLNRKKCIVVSYGLCDEILLHNYNIDGNAVHRSSTIYDLGVLYDSKLNFNEHVHTIASTASKTIGFILRNCKDFNTVALITLYNALVRSKLEYCALCWFPYYNRQILILENTQRRFLKHLYYKEERRWPERNYPHVTLLAKFNFSTLHCRRICSALLFLHKLLNNVIDCSELLEKLHFSTSSITMANCRLV